MNERTTLDWALAYRDLGWSVIPLRPKEKRPLIRWQPYQTRKATEAAVRRWFSRWPDANVGVVTGAISGLVVLDVDPAHGGTSSLDRLEAAHSALPPTVSARTGGGGRHLYFRHPGGDVRNMVEIAPGLDLRGDGGYVVAPPSIHPSGGAYAWEPERSPDRAAPAPMPPWLLHPAGESAAGFGHPVRYWRALIRDGVGEGARNNTIASLAGHLLWHGVDPTVVLDLLLCWNAERCRPPLSDDEVAQTVQSITRTHFRHRDWTEGM